MRHRYASILCRIGCQDASTSPNLFLAPRGPPPACLEAMLAGDKIECEARQDTPFMADAARGGLNMSITIKRVYAPSGESDGCRILVDRLWPRGLRKDHAAVELWLKDIAPSDELRRRFGHDPAKWRDFRRSYLRELEHKPQLIEQIARRVEEGPVTLLYSAHDAEHNNAAVLLDYMQHRIPVKT